MKHLLIRRILPVTVSNLLATRRNNVIDLLFIEDVGLSILVFTQLSLYKYYRNYILHDFM